MIEDKPIRINWILGRATLSGGVKSNRLIAEAMVRRGHDVTIYFVDVPLPRPPIWRVKTLTKHFIGKLSSIGKQKHHLEQCSTNLEPIRHRPISSADVRDADVTIATWWETAHWIKDWPSSKGVKAYFIRHYELHGGDSELVEQTYRLPYKKFVIASWLKSLMVKEFDDNNVTLVPNGVDWNQFNFIPRNKNPVPTVGMLFGTVNWKGAKTAFKAIQLAQKRKPELRVICFGAQRIAKNFDKPENFQFHFRPEQEIIPEIYRSVDCWLVPSTTEGFGMPGLEAAACGCPVVSTRCGGPEDYVKEGCNGYLVDVGDEKNMADKLLKVIQLPEKEWQIMSAKSADMAKQFDWDKSAAILEQALYVQLAMNEPGS